MDAATIRKVVEDFVVQSNLAADADAAIDVAKAAKQAAQTQAAQLKTQLKDLVGPSAPRIVVVVGNGAVDISYNATTSKVDINVITAV